MPMITMKVITFEEFKETAKSVMLSVPEPSGDLNDKTVGVIADGTFRPLVFSTGAVNVLWKKEGL